MKKGKEKQSERNKVSERQILFDKIESEELLCEIRTA